MSPAEPFPYLQTPALDQRGCDGFGIATAAPSLCLLLACLSSSEIINKSWECAKSHKTDGDTQNVAAFSAESQRA